MHGATVLPHAVFDTEKVLKRIEAERVTLLPGPPTIFQSLLAGPYRDYDLSSLRVSITGAASVPVTLIEEMRGKLGIDVVLTAYGLTETCGTVSMCRAGDDAVVRNGFYQIFTRDDDEVTGLLVADSTRLHARLDERQQLFIRHRGQFFEVAAGSAIENFVHGLSSLLNVRWSRRVIIYSC